MEWQWSTSVSASIHRYFGREVTVERHVGDSDHAVKRGDDVLSGHPLGIQPNP